MQLRGGGGDGHPVNPHLFRDCAATNIAIDDPDHIGIVWRLLGHRTPATTEKYYNLAGAVEASRRFQNTLLARRHGGITRNRGPETDDRLGLCDK